jgi:hypothetical protein
VVAGRRAGSRTAGQSGPKEARRCRDRESTCVTFPTPCVTFPAPSPFLPPRCESLSVLVSVFSECAGGYHGVMSDAPESLNYATPHTPPPPAGASGPMPWSQRMILIALVTVLVGVPLIYAIMFLAVRIGLLPA